MFSKQPLRFTIGVILAIIVLLSISYTQAQPLIPLPAPSVRAVELLTNTSFEADSDADKIPDGWTGVGTNTEIASDKQKCNKPDKPVALTGICAFQFKGNEDGTGSSLEQSVTSFGGVTNGASLTLSAQIDVRSSTPDSTFGKVVVKYSNGTQQKLTLSIPGNDDRAPADYVLVSDTETLSIPAGASITSIKVKFSYNRPGGKYLLDDVSLTVASADIVKLLANDGAANDAFGWSVAFNAIGDVALVSAYNDTVGGNNAQGSAYIFVQTGSGWAQQAQLIATDGAAGDTFGNSVALSADGNTAIIGAATDDVGANNAQGSAYVFTRTGTVWAQQAQLVVSDGTADDNFGFSVGLSGDGNTALVGAFGDDVGANSNQGSAYIFVRTGTAWTQQQQLIASDGTVSDALGYAVALNADGNTAALAAPAADIAANVTQGAAYVFVRSGTAWAQQAKIIASDGVLNDQLGFAVALSADGNTLLASSPYIEVGANVNQGAAYAFTRNGTAWTQQAKLITSDGQPGDFLGYEVAISADGNRALIGAPADTNETGSVYAFTRSGSAWVLQAKRLAPNSLPGDVFGVAVALNANGDSGLVSAWGANTNQGAVYVMPMP